MQKYVLDRNGNTVATFASDYNDKHTKTLQAGASTYEFTISKQDEAALFLETGNYINFVDDVGKPWSFSILSYTETHNEKTVYCEDVGIELINKNVNSYKADAAYSFAFYFETITKNTPWTIGINEISDLSRKLEWTSNDTGLSRLLSLLTEFDNAECKFNVKLKRNQATEFKVDIYKQIGNPQTNVQIVYSNELNDITKTESRTEFVTAIQGEGGTPTKNADGTDIVTGTNPDGTTIETPKITFADIEYKDDNYISPKGDKFLRAVTANKLFNPNAKDVYLEGYYSYETESPQELLNRTLTQLKKYSAPQYTYEADVQVIDKNLDLGDTIKIIDHDYKPGLYLSARVASLEKSYTDPTKNTITFTNYKLVNSSLAQKLADLQNIINSMPTASGISSIITNVINNSNVIEQKILALESADGRSTVYYDAKPSNAKEGDTAFVKNPDSGNMEIWNYVGDQWTLTAGDATFDDLKTQIDKAQTDAQTAIDKANSAVSNANKAVSDAGFATNIAKDAKASAAEVEGMLGNYATQSWSKSEISTAKNEITASVQNMTSDMATQTWTQGKLNLTADGFTSQISSVKNGLDTKYTSLEQTLSGVQVTANNAVTQSQYTQLAGQVTSTISAVQGGGINLLTNTSDFSSNWAGISSVSTTTEYNGHPSMVFTSINQQLASQITGAGKLENSSQYTSSFWAKADNAGDKAHTELWGSIGTTDFVLTTEWVRYTAVVTSAPDVSTNIILSSCFFGIPDGNKGNVYIALPKLEKGTIATPWSAAPEDIQSQITQTQSDINLRVQKGDVINQINISPESILIAGQKVHITGQTTIDSGIITNAMIGNATIEAAKIKDGAITNAKIANLDGGKITANSITADKLDVNAIAVGLNTYGSGWKITPGSIAFLPPGVTKSSLSLTGNLGIMFGDIGNGESLAVMQGTPYDTTKDTSYNGLQVDMLNNGDFFGLSAETGTTTEAKMIWSRSAKNNFNIKKGFSFYDDAFFAKNVETKADLFINRIGIKDANNNGHTLKYNWVDGVGIAQLAGNNKAGVLIEEVGGDVKFMIDGSQYSLRDVIAHTYKWV